MFIKSRALTMLKRYAEADKVNTLCNNDEQHDGDGVVDKLWKVGEDTTSEPDEQQ